MNVISCLMALGNIRNTTRLSTNFTTAYNFVKAYDTNYIIDSFRKFDKDFNVLQGLFKLSEARFQELCSLAIDRVCSYIDRFYKSATPEECMKRANKIRKRPNGKKSLKRH